MVWLLMAKGDEGKVLVREKTTGPNRREELLLGGRSIFSEETQLAKAETEGPTQTSPRDRLSDKEAPRVITRRSCQIQAPCQGYAIRELRNRRARVNPETIWPDKWGNDRSLLRIEISTMCCGARGM